MRIIPFLRAVEQRQDSILKVLVKSCDLSCSNDFPTSKLQTGAARSAKNRSMLKVLMLAMVVK